MMMMVMVRMVVLSRTVGIVEESAECIAFQTMFASNADPCCRRFNCYVIAKLCLFSILYLSKKADCSIFTPSVGWSVG